MPKKIAVRQPSRTAASDPTGVSSIKVVSQLTGLQMGTLRAWERRYGFPMPARRADSNRRLYSNEQIERLRTVAGAAAIGSMHLAKGLEYRAVVVMACDDDVLPLAERVAAVDDAAELKDVFDTERQLLYVACTRARDFLLVTGSAPGSAFLGDLRGGD